MIRGAFWSTDKRFFVVSRFSIDGLSGVLTKEVIRNLLASTRSKTMKECLFQGRMNSTRNKPLNAIPNMLLACFRLRKKREVRAKVLSADAVSSQFRLKFNIWAAAVKLEVIS